MKTSNAVEYMKIEITGEESAKVESDFGGQYFFC